MLIPISTLYDEAIHSLRDDNLLHTLDEISKEAMKSDQVYARFLDAEPPAIKGFALGVLLGLAMAALQRGEKL